VTDNESKLAGEIAGRVLRMLGGWRVDDPRLSLEEGGAAVKVDDTLVFPTLTGLALRKARARFYAELDRLLVDEHEPKRVKPGLYRYE
jgi:hypothetical protein